MGVYGPFKKYLSITINQWMRNNLGKRALSMICQVLWQMNCLWQQRQKIYSLGLKFLAYGHLMQTSYDDSAFAPASVTVTDRELPHTLNTFDGATITTNISTTSKCSRLMEEATASCPPSSPTSKTLVHKAYTIKTFNVICAWRF